MTERQARMIRILAYRAYRKDDLTKHELAIIIDFAQVKQ